ncbi:MAG: hypothetical protein HS113_20585 [Verrucomicrobiales bacterium]|nr:hypothetical protein [Verrucomicrobiales bacterium]
MKRKPSDTETTTPDGAASWLKAPTLGAAAARLNVAPEVLRAAKAQGAAGFSHNGAVNLLQVARWALTRGTPPAALNLDQARAKLATAKATILEKRSQIEVGELAPVAFALAGFDRAHEMLMEFAHRLPDEYKVTQQGLGIRDQAELRRQLEILGAVTRRIVATAREVFIDHLRRGPTGEGGGLLDEAYRTIETAMAKMKEVGQRYQHLAPEAFDGFFRELKRLALEAREHPLRGEDSPPPPGTAPTEPAKAGKPARRRA